MSDATETLVTSSADAETQARAEKLGWIPPARFKGDPERFVDAAEYIERGETVLPIVKEQNRRLEQQIAELTRRNEATAQALTQATQAIDEMQERHSVETQKAVERARKELKAQLAAASEAGDHEGVAELTDKLVQMNAAEKDAEEGKEPKKAAPAPYVPPAELTEWNADNPWFGKDRRKTALALGIAQELREAGDKSIGREFFDKVTEELNKTLGQSGEPASSAASKVEGARNGSDSDSRSGPQKSYANLPADAKEACDKDAKQFVGPGKKYKTQAEWRSRYAQLYFGE